MAGRLAGCALGLALIPVPSWALQATVFKGRLVVEPGGPPVTQMKVRLGDAAAATPNAAGYFVAAVPARLTSVRIEVETGRAEWQVKSPAGPVAVPGDTLIVTEVYIGPSFKEKLTQFYGAETARLSSQLREAGVTDSLILAAMRDLRKEFREQGQLREEDLDRSAQRGARRAEVYPTISAAIERYVIKLQNVQIAFKYIAGSAFSNDSAFAQLKQAILDYNPALEMLMTQRGAFEHSVREYWGSEQLSAELRTFTDYALGEIHDVHILPLNALIPDISAVLRKQVTGAAGAQKQRETVARIRDVVSALEPRLNELTRRKTRLLAELQAL